MSPRELQQRIDELWGRVGAHEATGTERRVALQELKDGRDALGADAMPLPTDYKYDAAMFDKQLAALEEGLPHGEDTVAQKAPPACDPQPNVEAGNVGSPEATSDSTTEALSTGSSEPKVLTRLHGGSYDGSRVLCREGATVLYVEQEASDRAEGEPPRLIVYETPPQHDGEWERYAVNGERNETEQNAEYLSTVANGNGQAPKSEADSPITRHELGMADNQRSYVACKHEDTGEVTFSFESVSEGVIAAVCEAKDLPDEIRDEAIGLGLLPDMGDHPEAPNV